MTDTWDELWKEISIDSITQSNVSNSWVKNILDQIKVEGDKLKYHADWVRRLENFNDINFHQRKIIAIPKSHYDGLKERADKWDLAVSNIWDEESIITPERMALGINVLNQHFDTCETHEQMENQIDELLEFEDKIDAVMTHIKKEMEFHAPDMNEGAWLNDHLQAIMKILGEQSSTETPT